MINKIPKRNYILMLALLYASGTPVSTNQYASTLVALFIIVFVIFILFKPNKNIAFQKKSFIYFLSLYLLILTTLIINLDNQLQSYLGFIIVILTAFIYTHYMDFDSFKNCYVRIIFILAIISLPFYFIGLLSHNFINQFPTYYLEYTLTQAYKNVYFLYFYNYHPLLGIDYSQLTRNSGIFREPGVYQIYLNTALLICLHKQFKYKRIVIIIFIITILTTFSTVGFMTMVVFLLASLPSFNINKKEALKYIIIVILGTMAFIYFEINYYSVLFSKFNANSISHVSYLIRLEGTIQDLEAFFHNIIFGIGVTNYKNLSIGTANALTNSLAVNGIIFTYITFNGLFNTYKNFVGNNAKTLMFVDLGLLFIVFSQSLLFFPFIQVVIFYSFKGSAISRQRLYPK